MDGDGWMVDGWMIDGWWVDGCVDVWMGGWMKKIVCAQVPLKFLRVASEMSGQY